MRPYLRGIRGVGDGAFVVEVWHQSAVAPQVVIRAPGSATVAVPFRQARARCLMRSALGPVVTGSLVLGMPQTSLLCSSVTRVNAQDIHASQETVPSSSKVGEKVLL